MGRHDQAVAPVHASDLLDPDRVRDRVQPAPLELLWNEHPEEAEARHHRNGLLGELARRVELRRDRLDLALRELPHLLPDHLLLGRGCEVHGGEYDARAANKESGVAAPRRKVFSAPP